MPVNKAAWIDAKGTNLRVGDAPMPSPGPGEIVIRGRSVAINPLDWHMQDWGVFIKEWPSIFGCDVAGEVYQVGAEVSRFKPGDRVTA
jgi:NADPH:quinone reductase-like Zn-dependent oxidoreductase